MYSFGNSCEIGELASPGDRVEAALLLSPVWDEADDIGAEPASTAIVPVTQHAIERPTLLQRIEKIPEWQLALLAVGLGGVVALGLWAVFGGKAAVAAVAL